MLKKIFLFLSMICAINTALHADHSNPLIDGLKHELENAVLNQDISIADQKTIIEQVHEKLKKQNIIHTSLLQNTCSYSRCSRIDPEILEFLTTKLGYPTKDALIQAIKDFPNSSITPKTIKNLRILRHHANLTESESRKLYKYLHQHKLFQCKKTIIWSPKEREKAKYDSECIATKKLEKIFKPQVQSK